MPNESLKKTLIVATLLCIVCSVLVSAMSVSLRPAQERNKLLDKKRNILIAAGLYEPGKDTGKTIDELFENIETRVVTLATGEFSTDVDPAGFDERKATRDPQRSIAIPPEQDSAVIKRRAHNAVIYLVRENEKITKIILPACGMGLWGTMFGMIAIQADLKTVGGFVIYEHIETPGLGGEVDNPRWRSKWSGKLLFDDQGNRVLHVLKGQVDTNRPEAIHQIDGLSGATFTTRGLENMLEYWLGNHGFGPFLKKIRAQGVENV